MSEFKSSGEFATTWVGGLGLIQGEEIVRCKDCIYYLGGERNNEINICRRVNTSTVQIQWEDTDPNGYCWRGVSRHGDVS